MINVFRLKSHCQHQNRKLQEELRSITDYAISIAVKHLSITDYVHIQNKNE